MNQRELILFLSVIEKLKCNTRHSWTSTGRQESVAEHSWRLAVMAMFLDDEFVDIDINKVIHMSLIHDFGEALTGDIPAFNKTEADEKAEALAITQLLSLLPHKKREELSLLFDEMETLSTPEAKLWRGLDKLEALISHNEAPLSTWLPLEYEENLTYGTAEVQWSVYLSSLKEEIKRDALKKMSGEE